MRGAGGRAGSEAGRGAGRRLSSELMVAILGETSKDAYKTRGPPNCQKRKQRWRGDLWLGSEHILGPPSVARVSVLTCRHDRYALW